MSIARILQDYPAVGLDIVEVSPQLDPTQATSHLSARFLYEWLFLQEDSKGSIEMKLILTGFSPFADIKVNPSQVIVDNLINNGRLAFPHFKVTCSILPTEYVAAERQIIKLIDSVDPDVIICLGVDTTSTELRLEQVALNIDDATITDNAGEIRHNCMIIPDGPPAYFSTFPFKEIWKDLINVGIPVRISYYAGTYICNHVYYKSLHHIRTNELDILCGFIHIPLLSDIDSGIMGGAHLKCEDILRTLKLVLTFLHQKR